MRATHRADDGITRAAAEGAGRNPVVAVDGVQGGPRMKTSSDPQAERLLERVVETGNMKRAWKQVKQNRPDETSAINYCLHKISKLGVAALPLMIQKIGEGETDFILLVSELTEGEVKKDATAQECLLWWANNKQRWIIPFKEADANAQP